ncbi:MAG: mechanosensitive ion channel family protein [Lachnospiraceae bacterium]
MNETTAAEEVVETTKNAVEEMNQFTAYLQENIPNIIGFGVKVLFAILFFLVGRAVIKWIRKIVRHSMERSNADVGVRQFVDSVLKVVLYFILLFSIATKFGVDAASVAALIASGGVAIGLALQGSLSNFAGGVLILLLKPFEVGDYIIEDTNKNEGTVKEIQIFYTKLSTIDNKTIVIPNGILTNNSLTNATAKDERRLDLKVDIAYEASIKEAKAVIETILKNDEAVLQDEDINVFVDALGESSVVLGARAWTKNEDFWSAKWRILEEIKEQLDDHHISIPYQQLMVHMAESQKS